MMQKIKYALAFLAGTIYASAWWVVITRFAPDRGWMIVPLAITSLGSLLIVVVVGCALIEHWND